jgi:hypothetical protein
LKQSAFGREPKLLSFAFATDHLELRFFSVLPPFVRVTILLNSRDSSEESQTVSVLQFREYSNGTQRSQINEEMDVMEEWILTEDEFFAKGIAQFLLKHSKSASDLSVGSLR